MRLVDRTLDVLEHLAEHPEGLGVVRLAEAIGEPASSIHRLLGALGARGYVAQDGASRRYRLGNAAIRLGHVYHQRNRLITVAGPFLADLSLRTLESVFLAELIGGDVICVASAQSPRPLSFYMRVGQRMPYHAASSARAILAFMPGSEQEVHLRVEPMERFTALTPTTLSAAMLELDRTRERGYAVCDREMEDGITAISAPIRAADGAVSASVTLVAPEDRLSGDTRRDTARLLIETADAISSELGYRSRPSLRAPDPTAKGLAFVAGEGLR